MAPSKRNLRQVLPKAYQIEYYEGLDFHSVKPHSHANYEFYLFLEGDAHMDMNGELHRLEPGDLVILPPRTLHVARVNPEVYYSRFDFWLPVDFIAARPEKLRYAAMRADEGQRFVNLSQANTNVIATKLFSIIEEQRTVRYAKEEQVELMFSELLLLISRAVVEKEQKDVDKENADIFTLVCDYIDSHLMEDLTIERLSKEFFVSKSYLSHLFQDTSGLSLHKFIQKKRLAMQRDAIKGGMSVAKVHAMSGMKDYSTFYRAFKKEYGVTPSEFARSVHKNQIES